MLSSSAQGSLASLPRQNSPSAACGSSLLRAAAGTQETDTHPLNRVEQTGQIYAGAEHGRFRCLGGTSTRWGGAMITIACRRDVERHTAGWVPAWQVPYERLMAQLPDIESKFGLPEGSYEDPEIIGAARRRR